MDSESLRIFKAVAELGSVTRAARMLHYVPSNVTARIRSLENELGKPLFIRKPRGMSLTPAGNMLLPYAQQVSNVLHEARASLDNCDGPAGVFRIGSTDSVVANWLANKLITYARRHVSVELSLEVAPSQQLTEKILRQELDAALISGGLQNSQLTATELFQEELVLVTAPDVADPLQAAQSVVLQRNGCSFRRTFEHWLARNGVTPSRTLELPSSDVALHCVAQGMGVAAMPVSTIRRLNVGDYVRTHPLPESLRHVPVQLIRDARLSRTKAYDAFENLCLEQEQGMTADQPLSDSSTSCCRINP